MDLLERLNTELETTSKNSRLFRAGQAGGVRHSEELDRILSLPRRSYTDLEAEILADELTAVLKTPTGKQRLRPKQAVSLLEIGQHRGLMGSLRAGAGKTLIFFLTPYILNSARPVLLMPAKLIDSKLRELQELSEHWRVAYWLNFLSYQSLSRLSKENYLSDLRCDCLLADEAHKLKNRKAACTRRVKEYLDVNVDVPFVFGSGTVTKRSIQDYHHLSNWALRAMSPVPREWAVAEEWGNAIDERPRSMFRTEPGALTKFSDGETDLVKVREGFQKRVTETPGVVSTQDKLVDCSLVVSRYHLEPSQPVTEAFNKLRTKWQTPDGWPLVGGLAVAQHARELALGFYYRWEPRAPHDWLEARKAWAAFVRHILTYNRSRLYSEMQVALACAKGKLPADEYHAWTQIKDTFKPNSVSVWVSDHALKACAAWLAEDKGIVWTEHKDFAHVLSEVTGVPYCGAGGVDKTGRPIEDFRGESVIASIASSFEGRNLQAWCRNLVTSPPGQGLIWEQLLARTHRDLQLEDEVTYEVLSGCAEHETAFNQARLDAAYIAETTGQEQRLRYGDIIWPEEIRHGSVWNKDWKEG